MLLTIYSPIGPDRWAVTVTPKIQIAEVILRDGHCTAAPATDRALNLAELDSIAAFMHEQEARARRVDSRRMH